MSQKISISDSFELSIHQSILKNQMYHGLHENMKSTAVLNIDIIRNVSCAY